MYFKTIKNEKSMKIYLFPISYVDITGEDFEKILTKFLKNLYNDNYSHLKIQGVLVAKNIFYRSDVESTLENFSKSFIEAIVDNNKVNIKSLLNSCTIYIEMHYSNEAITIENTMVDSGDSIKPTFIGQYTTVPVRNLIKHLKIEYPNIATINATGHYELLRKILVPKTAGLHFENENKILITTQEISKNMNFVL